MPLISLQRPLRPQLQSVSEASHWQYAQIIYGMLLIATAGSFLTSLYFFYAALRIELGRARASCHEHVSDTMQTHVASFGAVGLQAFMFIILEFRV